MNRVPLLFGRIVILCLLLTVSVGGQSSSLLGNLPIVGPLVANLPLVGGLLGGLLNGLLSSDLLGLLSAGDDRPVRAIVRGDVVAIQEAASRDGLPVLKVLDGLVVLQAAPSALQALLSVTGVDAISLDNLVSPTMSVSTRRWRPIRRARPRAACCWACWARPRSRARVSASRWSIPASPRTRRSPAR